MFTFLLLAALASAPQCRQVHYKTDGSVEESWVDRYRRHRYGELKRHVVAQLGEKQLQWFGPQFRERTIKQSGIVQRKLQLQFQFNGCRWPAAFGQRHS